MNIISFEVNGLLGREGRIAANLNRDINIITGKNGAGKTTLLKLIWYIVSGNILIALQEINFKSITIITDLYEITVYRLGRNTCKIDFYADGKKTYYEDIQDEDGDYVVNAEDEVNPFLVSTGNSLFLPTFRRIEGGFTLNRLRTRSRLLQSSKKGDIEEALDGLSRKLSNDAHYFVCSISTADIVELLLKEYANLSQQYTEYQQLTSENVIQQIKSYKMDKDDVKQIDAANHVLDEVRRKIENMEAQRSSIMSPITAVQELVEKIFNHSGIQIGARLNFGDAAQAINSDLLSAGEKQMLSFICYNAFRKDSIIFIDEPELSLHVDWQRQLFPVLRKQQASNQFIVATHSPFIYSKYPDKEIMVDADRGDLEDADE